MKSSTLPDGIPVLSRGRHRSPRRGACFMELASVLAGERWSDHPSCTHPLLAEVARRVNDRVNDAERQELLLLVPSVVGRRGDDRTWLTVAVAAAASVVLDVTEPTQRVLAGGLLQAESLCGTRSRASSRPAAPTSTVGCARCSRPRSPRPRPRRRPARGPSCPPPGGPLTDPASVRVSPRAGSRARSPQAPSPRRRTRATCPRTRARVRRAHPPRSARTGRASRSRPRPRRAPASAR